MSSTDVSTVLSALLSEMKTLNGRISTLEGLVSVKPASGAGGGAPKKERKSKAKSSESGEEKPKREPSAWRLFADRVRQTLREAGFEGKSLGTECVQFCSALKEENPDFSAWSESDILARRGAWTAPEVSKGEQKMGKGWATLQRTKKARSAAASVASDGDSAPASDGEGKPKKERKNPWANLSEEERAERIAKMKAGRAAKKAAEAASEEAPASDGEGAPSVSSSEKKKRGPKKHSEMTPEELAADKAKRAAKKAAKSAEEPKPSAASASSAAAAQMPLPASPASSTSSKGALVGFQRVMLLGAPYWVNLGTGHCYHRLADGGQGEWAGLFHRTPKPHIDDSVPEPSEDDGFVLED
jgi:hypothetical protein